MSSARLLKLVIVLLGLGVPAGVVISEVSSRTSATAQNVSDAVDDARGTVARGRDPTTVQTEHVGIILKTSGLAAASEDIAGALCGPIDVDGGPGTIDWDVRRRDGGLIESRSETHTSCMVAQRKNFDGPKYCDGAQVDTARLAIIRLTAAQWTAIGASQSSSADWWISRPFSRAAVNAELASRGLTLCASP